MRLDIVICFEIVIVQYLWILENVLFNMPTRLTVCDVQGVGYAEAKIDASFFLRYKRR